MPDTKVPGPTMGQAPTAPLMIDTLTVSVGRRAAPRHIVRGVSLAVRSGSITGLLGETGSGKTMTALSLLRLLPPGAWVSGGRVSVAGKDLAALSDRQVETVRGREVAMIFQDPLSALNPVRTIGFQLREPMRRHLGLGRAAADGRAIELLDSVGIRDPRRCLRQYPHELSGGMRQRVMIAMALSCRPRVLIADEPTTALDVTVQAQVLDLIRRLTERHGLAVLYVTHDLGTAARICDDIAVMYAGAIVEHGPASAVLGGPRHPYTRALMECLADVHVRRRPMPVLPGQSHQAWSITDGCRFRPRCSVSIGACATREPQLLPETDHRSACHVTAVGVPETPARTVEGALTPPAVGR